MRAVERVGYATLHVALVAVAMALVSKLLDAGILTGEQAWLTAMSLLAVLALAIFGYVIVDIGTAIFEWAGPPPAAVYGLGFLGAWALFGWTFQQDLVVTEFGAAEAWRLGVAMAFIPASPFLFAFIGHESVKNRLNGIAASYWPTSGGVQ